jgi:hypothetical protein
MEYVGFDTDISKMQHPKLSIQIGNCIEMVDTYTDEYFDAADIDPPYKGNSLFDAHGNPKYNDNFVRSGTNFQYNNGNILKSEVLDLYKNAINAISPKLKSKGILFLKCQDLNIKNGRISIFLQQYLDSFQGGNYYKYQSRMIYVQNGKPLAEAKNIYNIQHHPWKNFSELLIYKKI